MKVRANSNKMVTHPHTTSRRERALAQRERELSEWLDEKSKRYKEQKSSQDGEAIIAKKIAIAEADIANLKKKVSHAA